jgi:hypothetical protein
MGLSLLGSDRLLFKRKDEPKNRLLVDLGDVQNEKENLTNFLQSHLKVTVYSVKNKLAVDSEKVTQADLYHAVKKFVYHRALNNTHWVSEGVSTVKINRFKRDKKKKEPRKKEALHQTEIQTWGL